MKLDLTPQFANKLTLPLMPVGLYTGSALPLEMQNIPATYCGGEVTAVSVTATNADGLSVTGSAIRSDECETDWFILFAASNFATYGDVKFGIRVTVTVTTSFASYDVVVGVGDLNIAQASANATPGEAGASYVTKGSDLYVRTQEVDGVQHYTKQVMSYDSRVGWGASWEGDYILDSSGNYIVYTA